MAMLPDADLKRILGDNFRDKQDALDAESGLDDASRDEKARLEALQMRKSFVVYVCLVGLVLTAAARFAATNNAMWIQVGIAMTVAILAAGYYLYLRAEVNRGMMKAAKA